MKRFWSYHGWEALPCLAAAVTLVLNFSQGFYIPDAVADSVPLALLVCGGTLLYCCLGSLNKGTIVSFSVGFLVIAAGSFLWMGQAGIDIVDQEGSPTAVYIYWIAAPVITVLTFLLSRSRLGTVVLFLLGICLHGLIAFLGFEVKVWCAALFPLAMVVLFWMRQYRVTVMRGSAASPGFGRCFGLSAGLGLAGLVLALLCWALVVRPLHPPTLDVELLTKYMRYEILEMVGITKQYPVPDEEKTSPGTDQALLGSGPEVDPEAPPDQQAPEESADGPSAPQDAQDPSETTDLRSVTYEMDVTGGVLGAVLLTVLVLALIPVLTRLWRRRRMARLTRGEPREQVVALYRFYLTRFARIGYPRAPTETEREYAERCGEHLAPYLEGGPDLERMTALYLDARYGGLAASETDCRAMTALYPAFLRNYRVLAGRWRYLTKYFVL